MPRKPNDADAYPVGRNKHPGGLRVECRPDILHESEFHVVFILRFAASFSNTARKASVTTSARFLEFRSLLGRQWRDSDRGRNRVANVVGDLAGGVGQNP